MKHAPGFNGQTLTQLKQRRVGQLDNSAILRAVEYQRGEGQTK